MSQENVELVRRYVGALTALGESGLELEGRRSAAIDFPEAASVFDEYWHPQAVFDVSLRLDGGVYYGPEGVRRAFRDWFAGTDL